MEFSCSAWLLQSYTAAFLGVEKLILQSLIDMNALLFPGKAHLYEEELADTNPMQLRTTGLSVYEQTNLTTS